MISLSLVPILGALGLVVDLGWGYYRKELCLTAAQSTAIAASMAAKSRASVGCGSGSTQVPCPTNSPCSSSLTTASDPIQAGCLYAQQNGFTNGGNNNRQSVVATGTTTGCIGGALYCVTFTVSETLPQTFSAILGHTQATASAQSTGAVFKSSGGCVYILDATAQKAFTYTGSTFPTGCGVYINSNATNAFYLTGGTINLNNGAGIYVHGQEFTSGGTVSPNNVFQNQASVSDPFSGLTAPTPAGTCDNSWSDITDNNNHTLGPGTYCSFLLKGTGTITLTTGTYYMEGNFQVKNGTVDATAGVTIYFWGSDDSNMIYSGGALNITAPSTGDYQGIAIWKDGTPGTPYSVTWTGTNDTINGAIYEPHTNLTFTGGSQAVDQTIVVNTLKYTGGTITESATSSHFSGGGATGAYFVQ